MELVLVVFISGGMVENSSLNPLFTYSTLTCLTDFAQHDVELASFLQFLG